MKKNNRKEILYSSDEMKRHIGALHEAHIDGLKAIGERFDVVDSNFEKIDERFEQMDQRFEKIDERFEQMDQRFEKIDERFEQMDQRFEKIDERFSGVDMQLGLIREDVDFIKSNLRRKVDQEEFEALTRRVITLEKRVLK